MTLGLFTQVSDLGPHSPLVYLVITGQFVLPKFTAIVPGKGLVVLFIWIVVVHGPTALAVGTGGGRIDFFLSSIMSLFFLPL